MVNRLLERLTDAMNEPQDLGHGDICELARDALIEIQSAAAFGGGFYGDDVKEATREVYRNSAMHASSPKEPTK
jgi:hypothetical protein